MLNFNFHRSLKIFLFYVITLICIIKCASVSDNYKKKYELITNHTTVQKSDTKPLYRSSDQPPDQCNSVENDDDNSAEIGIMGRSNVPKRNCIPKSNKSSESTIHHHKCGFRNRDDIQIKSIGGTDDSKLFEFPWMVAIYEKSSDVLYNSAGTLIHPKIVLTVAHHIILCSKHLLVVRAGELNLNKSTNNLIPYDRNVEKIIIHDEFNIRNYHYDIALMILDKPFDLSDNIQTICLPPPLKNFDNNVCTLSTWKNENNYVGPIQKFDLPIVSNNECQERIRNITGKFSWKLHISFICAGNNIGKDSTTGDGGSPLICPIENTKNQYYQVGIVAGGIKHTTMPVFYTNIPYLRSWIDKTLNNESLSMEYYI